MKKIKLMLTLNIVATTIVFSLIGVNETIRPLAETNNIVINDDASKKDPEETVRVIVQLKDKPAMLKHKKGIQSTEGEINEVKKSQEPVKKKAKEKTNGSIRKTYGNLVNGFSIDVKRKDIESLKTIDNVSTVTEAKMYYPQATSLGSLFHINSNSGDNLNKGEGEVISIIDTGIDYKHKDMRLTHPFRAKLNRDNVNIGGKGKFYTNKIPYGYNFADDNDNIIDTSGVQDMHGMHVAGIASANSSDSGVKGVAPEAQLLAMKVFSNNPNIRGAYSDDIIAAIEESVKLHADVINLSLGSTGFRDSRDPEQIAIKNAVDSGVVVVAAAGNDDTSTDLKSQTQSINAIRDNETLHTPGLAKDAIQVASSENNNVGNHNLMDLMVNLNKSSNKMSEFSSWGPAPDLSFAPQITAPGGRIYSTANDNGYQVMSGTSMATPNVSGSIALILESLKNDGINLKGRDLVEFVKKSAINTAKVEEETTPKGETIPYSPRKQGSGTIQINDAVKNKVIAVGDDGEATISLKEIGNKKEFNITLINKSNKDETYKITPSSVLAGYQPSMNNLGNTTNEGHYDVKLNNSSIMIESNQITVKANQSAKIRLILNIGDDIAKDDFVEGFIKFIANDSNTPSLVVPYMGYYGDWSKEKIIDSPVWDSNKLLLGTYFITQYDNDIKYLGSKTDNKNDIKADKIAISPNGDGKGDFITPVFCLLRNAKKVNVDLLDKDKQLIKSNVVSDRNLSKVIMKEISNGGTLSEDGILTFNGLIFNQSSFKYETLKDGDYYLNYKGMADGTNKYQDYLVKFKVDTQAIKSNLESPTQVNSTNYRMQLSFNGELRNGNVNLAKIFVNGSEIGSTQVNDDILSANVSLNNIENNKIEVKITDEAFNTSTDTYYINAKNAKVDNSISISRISGQDRYETSYKVFETGWNNSDNVIIASGSNYPDALCAAPLAKKYNAPIILASNASLNNQPRLLNLLNSKAVKNVFIVSGVNGISGQFESELIGKGIRVTRLAGNDRYETSVKIAKAVKERANEVIAVSAENFADALSISSVAAKKDMPILLTSKNNLPNTVRSYLSLAGVNKAYAIGLTSTISDNVLSNLPNAERIGGSNRYETNKNVFEKFKLDINKSTLYVASGEVFPDALSISALTSKNGEFVSLAGRDYVDQSTANLVKEIKSSASKAYITGGENTLSNNIINNLGLR